MFAVHSTDRQVVPLQLFVKDDKAPDRITTRYPDWTTTRRSARSAVRPAVGAPRLEPLVLCLCRHSEPSFEGCGMVWNTFSTRGCCPGCSHQWRWTSVFDVASGRCTDWYEREKDTRSLRGRNAPAHQRPDRSSLEQRTEGQEVGIVSWSSRLLFKATRRRIVNQNALA